MSKFLPINLFIRQGLLYPLTFPFLPAENKVEKDHKYAAGRLTGTLVAFPARGIPKTGQTKEFRTGDDGDLEIGFPLTPPRFTDIGNETIRDNATGLMWVKEVGAIGGNFGSAGSPALFIWNNAIDECIGLTYGGHSDWRLPNQKELISIVNYGTYDPAIDEDFFPSTQNSYYWASGTQFWAEGNGWRVSFSSGVVAGAAKGGVSFVRPVRGPD